MSKMWNWIRREFREILPIWLFFFLAMGLLSFTISAVLGKYHIELSRPHEYLVGSLIIAFPLSVPGGTPAPPRVSSGAASHSLG